MMGGEKENKDGCRCTGHCCEDFHLPLSPEKLMNGYHRWRSTGENLWMNDQGASALYRDIWLIAPMVVHLGYVRREPLRVNPTDEDLRGEPLPLQHRYRCKHFDPETRDCTIYEIRPSMCRDYPGLKGCDYAACTWESHKAVKQTPEEIEARRARLIGASGGVEKVEVKSE